MRKKAKASLHLVDAPAADPTAPPADLGSAGAALWASIMGEFDVADAPGKQTLLQICHAADIADAAHERGMLKDELAARSFITRGLHRMNFDVEPTRAGPGRPPGPRTRPAS